MAKKGGRPTGQPGPERETKTRPVRVYDLDGDLLYWIGEVLRRGSAEILKPIIRPELTALYERLRPQIETLKRMRAEEERLHQQVKLEDFDELFGSLKTAEVEPPKPEPHTTRRPRRPPAGES